MPHRQLIMYVILAAVSGVACGAAAAWAAPAVSPSAPQSAAISASNLTQTARILWLDKQTNQRTPLVLAVGTSQTVAGLQIALTKCIPDYANQPGQDLAWLDVREVATRQTPWFAGWMFSTASDVSTLDHPRYDMQLQGCGDKPRRIGRAASATDAAPDAAIADSEAPAGEEAPVQTTFPTAEVSGAAPAVQSDGTEEAQPAAQPKDVAPHYVPGVDAKPAPAKPMPAAPAGAGASQGELHKMMEGGVY